MADCESGHKHEELAPAGQGIRRAQPRDEEDVVVAAQVEQVLEAEFQVDAEHG